jgi:hypothetical protein
MVEDKLNRETYAQWQRDSAVDSIMTFPDRSSEHKKYVIRSYLYTRSRLLVPGRNYEENNDHGPLSAGGNSHLDVIDFDIWLQENASDQDVKEAIDWMKDSSLEMVAYWRGLRSRSTIKRRRDKLVKNAQQNSPSTLRS